MLDPAKMLELFESGGREACIDELCVFPKKNGNLNVTMEKIVDCFVDSITGTVGVEDSIEKMTMLSERLRLEINDVVLDLYNDDEIEADVMVHTFEELRMAGKKELRDSEKN